MSVLVGLLTLFETNLTTNPIEYENPLAPSLVSLRSLHEAARDGDIEMIRAHLAAGIDPDSLDNFGNSALIWASRYCHFAVAQALLDAGANPNSRPIISDRTSPLLLAAECPSPELSENLLREGARIDSLDMVANTPLHKAVYAGRLKTVERLLKYGRETLNALNYGGHTPLTLAVLNEDIPMMKLLIENGASLRTGDFLGQTPLHQAIDFAKLEAIHLLVEAGSDIYRRDDEGVTPYDMAVAREKSAVVGIFRRKIFRTAGEFNKAVREGDMEKIESLISKGIDLNIVDISGRTPLMWAARENSIEIAAKLIKHGADVNFINYGLSALEEARRQNATDVFFFLLLKGAKR